MHLCLLVSIAVKTSTLGFPIDHPCLFRPAYTAQSTNIAIMQQGVPHIISLQHALCQVPRFRAHPQAYVVVLSPYKGFAYVRGGVQGGALLLALQLPVVSQDTQEYGDSLGILSYLDQIVSVIPVRLRRAHKQHGSGSMGLGNKHTQVWCRTAWCVSEAGLTVAWACK